MLNELILKEMTELPKYNIEKKFIKEFESLEFKESMVVIEQFEKVENMSLQQLELTNDMIDQDSLNDVKQNLTEDERNLIREETGWSDGIIDSIKSMEEYEVYKNANLQEVEINGVKCLIKTDIDMNQKDEVGRTNKERMENGQPPITKTGENVELHHIGQKADSPLAELTNSEHIKNGNDTILHDKQKESEIDRNEFRREREAHWESRADG